MSTAEEAGKARRSARPRCPQRGGVPKPRRPACSGTPRQLRDLRSPRLRPGPLFPLPPASSGEPARAGWLARRRSEHPGAADPLRRRPRQRGSWSGAGGSPHRRTCPDRSRDPGGDRGRSGPGFALTGKSRAGRQRGTSNGKRPGQNPSPRRDRRLVPSTAPAP